MRIDVSSANCRAKSHLQVRTSSERKRHINFFHINFLCRPASPGLSQGQTGFVPGTNPLRSGFHCVEQGENPGLSQVFTGFVPGTNPPGQPGVVPRPTGQKNLCLCVRYLLLGNERLLLGIIGVFGFFWNFFFCCWGFWDFVGRGGP